MHWRSVSTNSSKYLCFESPILYNSCYVTITSFDYLNSYIPQYTAQTSLTFSRYRNLNYTKPQNIKHVLNGKAQAMSNITACDTVIKIMKSSLEYEQNEWLGQNLCLLN